jgi:heptosyltransferase-3
MVAPLPAKCRSLVVSVARIGDTILATPVLRALKQAFPSGHLTVMAHPKRLEALRNLAFVDELRGINKFRALWTGWLGSFAYDVALVFGREPALVDYALRVASRVIAYDEPAFRSHPRLERVPLEEGTHAVLDRLRLLEPLGIPASGRCLAYEVTPSERRRARETLAATGRPLVGLQMSSFPTKAHRDWPIARFMELADGIVGRFPTAQFVVLGDESARSAAEPFLRRLGSRTLCVAGRTTLRESAALMGALDLYVGVDTGPTHIAGALGIPMVALYHCRYPGRLLAPLDHAACRVIEHPKSREGNCTGASMEDIEVAPVLEAALELLQNPAIPASAAR